MANVLLAATTGLHEILEPLSSEERQKAINAVLVLLGEAAAPPSSTPAGKSDPNGQPNIGIGNPQPASTWMQKNNISEEMLGKFIHIDAEDTAVIELPSGKSNKDKTIASYLMAGLSALFKSGTPSFSDDAARAICTHFGCYDVKNHVTYLKGLGNNITGTKNTGWKLTAPGLTAVANRIKGQDTGD